MKREKLNDLEKQNTASLFRHINLMNLIFLDGDEAYRCEYDKYEKVFYKIYKTYKQRTYYKTKNEVIDGEKRFHELNKDTYRYSIIHKHFLVFWVGGRNEKYRFEMLKEEIRRNRQYIPEYGAIEFNENWNQLKETAGCVFGGASAAIVYFGAMALLMFVAVMISQLTGC